MRDKGRAYGETESKEDLNRDRDAERCFARNLDGAIANEEPQRNACTRVLLETIMLRDKGLRTNVGVNLRDRGHASSYVFGRNFNNVGVGGAKEEAFAETSNNSAGDERSQVWRCATDGRAGCKDGRANRHGVLPRNAIRDAPGNESSQRRSKKQGRDDLQTRSECESQ